MFKINFGYTFSKNRKIYLYLAKLFIMSIMLGL